VVSDQENGRGSLEAPVAHPNLESIMVEVGFQNRLL